MAGAIIGGVIGGNTAYDMAREVGVTGWELVGWTAVGALDGAVIGGAIGAAAGAVIGGCTGVAAGYFGGGLVFAGVGGSGAGVLAGVSTGAAVNIGIGIGTIGSGISLMSKPDSGRLRYDDPMFRDSKGKPVSAKDAREFAKKAKGKEKLKWNQYWKSIGGKPTHLGA